MYLLHLYRLYCYIRERYNIPADMATRWARHYYRKGYAAVGSPGHWVLGRPRRLAC